METVIKTAKLLFIMLAFPLLTLCCKDDKEEEQGYTKDTTNEVRIPRVEDVDGKAVVTWADPYIADAKQIVVKDLQSNNETTVALAEFNITDNSLLSYRYELKVVKTSGDITNGVIIRLVKNWAQSLHPVIDYNSSATPQSGMFFKNQPVSQVKVFDIRNDENISKLSSSVIQGVVNQEYAQSYILWNDQHLTQLDDAGLNYQMQALGSTSKNKGFASLFNAYKDQFQYLVIWDENQSWSWSMALMICAAIHGTLL